MSFDEEHFIELIRERPSIWDQNPDEYFNKTTKQRCWQEVFCEMEDNYMDLPKEKKNIVEIYSTATTSSRSSIVTYKSLKSNLKKEKKD